MEKSMFSKSVRSWDKFTPAAARWASPGSEKTPASCSRTALLKGGVGQPGAPRGITRGTPNTLVPIWGGLRKSPTFFCAGPSQRLALAAACSASPGNKKTPTSCSRANLSRPAIGQQWGSEASCGFPSSLAPIRGGHRPLATLGAGRSWLGFASDFKFRACSKKAMILKSCLFWRPTLEN